MTFLGSSLSVLNKDQSLLSVPSPPPPPALHVILAAQEKKRCGPEEPFWSHSWTGVDPITLASAKPRGGRVRELSLSRPCPIVFLPDETEEQFYANQHV